MSTVTGGGRSRCIRGSSTAFALATVVWLISFAWRYADERLYADSSYYLVQVINEGGFRIEHGRWVLALAQWAPLLGVKLCLPVAVLIKAHSLNSALWLIGCVSFAHRVLRSPQAVMALVAVHVIGLAHGLFCPVFELYYGADLVILFHGVWHAAHLARSLRRALLVTFFIGAIASHPFGALLMLAMVAMDRGYRGRIALPVLSVVFLCYGVLHLFTLSAYEKDHYSDMLSASEPGVLAGIYSLERLTAWGAYALRHYPDVLGLSLVALFALLRTDRYWKAVCFVGTLVVLHAVISVKIPAFEHDRYREQVNFAATSWVVLVSCLEVLPLHKYRWHLLACLSIAMGYRVVRAERLACHYAERTAYIEGLISEARAAGMRKATGPWNMEFGTAHEKIDLSWSTSVESLLLSSRSGAEGTVSVITQEDRAFEDVAARLDGLIFRRWEIMPPGWLNARYFSTPAGRYVALPSTWPAP